MDLVQKALWYVESHLREPLSLEDVAAACHVSAYHLTRSFASTVGLSLMRYVRARRLSEAARRLAQGAEDILALALESGYGSHEAFTRAFREQFAFTPEHVRSQGHLKNLSLVEALVMNSPPAVELASPRFETLKPRIYAGFVERYNCQSPAGIPDQWQRFGPNIGKIPGQIGPVAYGVVYNFDRESNFDYMSGVEVTSGSNLPKGFTTLQVAEQRYVVFQHSDHVASIRSTLGAIWNRWFPESGMKAVDAPTLERYGPEFNPITGLGGVGIWIPIEARM